MCIETQSLQKYFCRDSVSRHSLYRSTFVSAEGDTVSTEVLLWRLHIETACRDCVYFGSVSYRVFGWDFELRKFTQYLGRVLNSVTCFLYKRGYTYICISYIYIYRGIHIYKYSFKFTQYLGRVLNSMYISTPANEYLYMCIPIYIYIYDIHIYVYPRL